MHERLLVEGSLQLSIDGRRIDVTAAGSAIKAEVGTAPAKPPSLRELSAYVKLARRMSRELEARGLSLSIGRNGKPIAELGAGARAGVLSRLIGIRTRTSLPETIGLFFGKK